ncbi:MAG: hypothetical protein CMG55_06520 [Candidatus Marinimicrobia bacterium]|nr:hypothetical protein [Candidatus Neomarinimicrobiota bacterium]
MRIGIIGNSEGNGHPYSWSAILNGFEKKYLNEVPFVLIRDYLKSVNPEDKLCKDVCIKKNFL